MGKREQKGLPSVPTLTEQRQERGTIEEKKALFADVFLPFGSTAVIPAWFAP